jgi:hypothetical protein
MKKLRDSLIRHNVIVRTIAVVSLIAIRFFYGFQYLINQDVVIRIREVNVTESFKKLHFH